MIEVLTPSNDTYLHDIPCGTGEEGSPHTWWTSSGDDSWTTRTGSTSSTSSGCELQNKVIKTSQDTFYLHTPVTAFVVRHGRRRRQRQAVRRRRGGGRGSNRQWQAVRRRQWQAVRSRRRQRQQQAVAGSTKEGSSNRQ